jgi:hypothetical protein
MSGYVAQARIVRAAPRLVRSGLDAARSGGVPRPGPGLAEIEADGAGDQLGSSLAERWHDVHERWAQLTYFLFDPDSWR